MHVINKVTFLILVLLLKPIICAKILCIASVPTYSHSVFFRPIWKALADRGHQLTVLTADPMEEPYPNIKEIDLHFVYRSKAEITKLTWQTYNWLKIVKAFEKMFKDVAFLELNHPEVQALLKNETEHFDLVIAEMHIPVMFGFAHRFKCPLIGISSTDIITNQHEALGNPTHPILYPDVFTPTQKNSFLGRLLVLTFKLLNTVRYGILKTNSVDHLRSLFGPDTPSIKDLTKNISMVFLNIHPVFNYRPLGPKFVTIGGAHIQKPKELPRELRTLLDNSTQGVVYFSLGTNVKISQYPLNFINTVVKALKELPYQIIWKLDYTPKNISDNVKVFKWIPQQDVLRHKNVKVFITQGGIHSMEEAICAKIPMVGIPFMSDQNRNVNEMVERTLGVALNKDTLTKEDLMGAIKEVIRNPGYKNHLRRIAKLLTDQPMTGLEKAVWYAEYAMRNKDINVIFTNPNQAIPWFQYYLLDVIVVVLLALILTFSLAYLILKFLYYFGMKMLISLIKRKKE